MSVRLFGHWTCPFVNRVAFALGQRDIDYTLISVPPSAVRPEGFVLPDEFVAHSPRLEVPLVCIDGDFLADSIPILHFLEDRVDAPTLVPPGEAELVIDRVAHLDATLMPSMGGVAYGVAPEKIERAAGRLADAFDEMADWLSETPWLAGSEATLAEAIAVPVYLRLPGLVALGFDRPLPAAVADHRERTLALPGGVAVAWTADQHAEYLARHRKARRLAEM
jgi:glutathione S-transferase